MTPLQALRILESNCAALFEAGNEPKAWEQRQAFTTVRDHIIALEKALQEQKKD